MPEKAGKRARAPVISIRRAELDDAAALAQLHGDPQVFPGLMQLPHPSAELWRTRVAENNQSGRHDLHLVACADNQLVGSAGLHPASPALRRRHAWMLGIAVAAAWHNRGVGSALMGALLDYADNWVGAQRIELTVFADNEAAQALYRKFGFQAEGLLKAYAMRHGELADVITMARLRIGG